MKYVDFQNHDAVAPPSLLSKKRIFDLLRGQSGALSKQKAVFVACEQDVSAATLNDLQASAARSFAAPEHV